MIQRGIRQPIEQSSYDVLVTQFLEERQAFGV